MNIDTFSLKTVKILAQKIVFDWIHPYKNETTKNSIGSGFFINNDGYILTCSHVVQSSKKIFIEIPSLGDNKIEVEVINICPSLDIALLKTKNYKNKQYFELHKPEYIYDLKNGCDVYAIGFPLGQDNLKITKGIISGREKSRIQTDAPMNPGNSGGPLLLNNKVIGINSSGILAASNIGYAVPIEYYYLIKKELFKNNNNIIRRPFIGITFHNTNKELLENETNKCNSGVYVKNVFKNSPISKTGIKKNDILCSINGLNVDNYGLFNKEWFNEKMKIDDIIRMIKINDIVSIEYSRKNKLYKKKFKFTNYQLEIIKRVPLYEPNNINYIIFGGFIAIELTQNILLEFLESAKFNLKNINKFSKYNNILKYFNKENQTKKRVIITYIFPNSILHNLSVINEFDIIDKVNNISISTIPEFKTALKKNKKKLKIITETNNKVILNIKSLLNEELLFSKTYKYKLNDIYNFFMNSRKTKKKHIKSKNINTKKLKLKK